MSTTDDVELYDQLKTYNHQTAAPAVPLPASPPAVEYYEPAAENVTPWGTAAGDVDEHLADDVDDQLGDVIRVEQLPPVRVEVTGVGFLARWLASNPVRVWLYGIFSAVSLLLVGYGLLTEQQAFLWAAVGAAVLGIPTTEGLRGSVYSPRGSAEAAAELIATAVAADRVTR